MPFHADEPARLEDGQARLAARRWIAGSAEWSHPVNNDALLLAIRRIFFISRWTILETLEECRSRPA
jgi:hypothetical protein